MRPLFELEKTPINVDWKVLKIKRLLDTPITDGPHETPELLDEGIPFLSAESVKKGKLDFNLKRGYISRENHEKYIKKCKPQRDDIFMIKSGATTGNVAMVETDEEFSIWSPLALIRAEKEKILPKYLYYYIGSDAFREQVEISWSYGTQQNIGMKVIENLFIALPSLHIQEKLVHYIENKVVQIDKLIEMKEQKISLLEQQRQSIITEAVTKGLNPNVKMKDSGVEWIGEIPEHWQMKKMKYIGQAVTGLTYSPEDLTDERGTIVLRSTNIQKGKISLHDNVYVDREIPNKLLTKKNDILICSRNGSRHLIGKNALVDKETNLSFGAFTTVFRSEYNDFIYFVLNSNFFEAQLGTYLTSTINQLTIGNLNNMDIVLPSRDEQLKIVGFLKEILNKYDVLLRKLENQIEKLKEYRQSLIYEAVTGKIDVRDMELDKVR